MSLFRMAIPGAVLVAAAAGWYAWGGDGDEALAYRTAALDRGEILQSVSSTGSLNPVVTVEVGSQVSGQISELLADFNTPVKAGQVIARLDPATLEARVLEARADLAVSRANVAMQRASLLQYEADIKGEQASLTEAGLELERRTSLFERRVVAKSEVERATAARAQAQARFDSAKARIAMQRAQVDNALATVEARAATMRSRELDLEHTVIRSPVDGVVISRDVAIGQTVAASLNAPVLFRIAQDLHRMQVELSVDEADIGRIREGQQVRFTVDAYPGRNYGGTVRQIRKAPKEVSNVVTYTVVVDTGNGDLSLLPGMTANAQVVVGRRDDALRVSNAALRFRPPGEELAPQRMAADTNPLTAAAAGFGGGGPRAFDARLKELDAALKLTGAQREAIQAVLTESGRKMRGLRRSGAETEHLRRMTRELRAETDRQIEALLDEGQRPVFLRMVAERDVERSRAARLWVQGPDGSPRAVEVMVGISDGNVTEIVRGELAAGDRVIVGMARPGS